MSQHSHRKHVPGCYRCDLSLDEVRAQEPHRVQQRRTKGWRKPENTVSVARPSRWGNPFRITPSGLTDFPWQVRSPTVDHLFGLHDTERSAREHVVELFEMHVGPMGSFEYDDETLAKLRHDLAGKNLMCFCPLDQPCHADVLLELANPVSIVDLVRGA